MTAPHTRMGLLISAMLATSLVTSIAYARPTLNTVNARMTDQAIQADHATYAATQARIAALNSNGIPEGDYALSKAQCWLDVSLHEYTRNDRSAFTQEALDQSDGILSALEQHTQPNPAEQTPLINHADRLREDLWSKADSLMTAPGHSCYAQKVACAEVELVHAGNEHKQQGLRHANPYLQIAENLLAEASATGASCIITTAPKAIATPSVTPIATPIVTPVATAEAFNLSASALFAFDQSTADKLLPAGKQTLDELATKLKDGYVQIDSIKLTGYTDRLGSAHYNQALSERRALTVKQYLQDQGIASPIETSGLGEADPVKDCGISTKLTETLKACLQENRRVLVEIKGVKKVVQ